MAKGLEIEIMAGEDTSAEDNMGMGFEAEVADAEMADEEMYMELAPKGRFSSKALNTLVKASNMLLPLFEQTPDYPTFDPGSYEVFPTDFTRVLSMFAKASKDAANEDVVTPELAISLEGVVDDQDVQLMAGKVQALAKSREFKKWLKEPAPEVKPEPVREELEGTEEMGEEDLDELFASRL